MSKSSEKEDGEYELSATYTGHKKAISSVSFSPDGTRTASACTRSPRLVPPLTRLANDKSVRLWDLTTGLTVNTIVGHAQVSRAPLRSHCRFHSLFASFVSTRLAWDGQIVRPCSGRRFAHDALALPCPRHPSAASSSSLSSPSCPD